MGPHSVSAKTLNKSCVTFLSAIKPLKSSALCSVVPGFNVGVSAFEYSVKEEKRQVFEVREGGNEKKVTQWIG